MLSAEDVAGPEWAEWYRLSPEARFRESVRPGNEARVADALAREE